MTQTQAIDLDTLAGRPRWWLPRLFVILALLLAGREPGSIARTGETPCARRSASWVRDRQD